MYKTIISSVISLSLASVIFFTDTFSQSNLAEGDIAPNFNLQDQYGEWHTLED
ncbi:MAG: hypothetical protein Ct9H300mP6_15110 [Gammaproteobacteria bacterium]|nr:MAG: hypothetical protein Ct9H300mP6_15110 [Gammaproteobacteria bacterium]